MTMTKSYANMKVDDFSLKGRPIEFSNPTFLSEYEKELKSRGLDYVVVKGLGDWGITWAIIVPEELDKYKTILMGLIIEKQRFLERHEDGLKELGVKLSAKDADVVLFTKSEVKKYLDACIRYSRSSHDKGDEGALYYVDAYQSVRMSLFGELLGKEEGDEASS